MYTVLVNFFDLFLFSEFYTTEFHALPVLLFSHRKRKYRREPNDESKPYVKKPPNAFMIYRAEQRPAVVAELQDTNCATVNRLIGQRVSVYAVYVWNFTTVW